MSKCIICDHPTRLLDDPQIKVKYDICEHCGFTYKKVEYHVSPSDEHGEYNNHNNSFESTGYVQMFERFIDNFIKPLNVKGVGLEFGSGPGPVLKVLLERMGITMYDFDPFFNPNTDYKTRKYQLITSTEVVEHFTNPMKEFKHLSELLTEDGYLVIMTNFNNFTDEEFLKWWYRRDKTHISFYNQKTFQYIANQFDLEVVEENNKNVVVFKKKTF